MKWGRFAEYLCGGLPRRVLTAPNHASAVLPLEGSSPSPSGSCLPGCAAEPEHGGGPCTGRGFQLWLRVRVLWPLCTWAQVRGSPWPVPEQRRKPHAAPTAPIVKTILPV